MTLFKHQARHLDITDLPSDRDGSLGGFRTLLLRTYNTARGHDGRLTLLATTLKMVLAHIENDQVKTKKGKK